MDRLPKNVLSKIVNDHGLTTKDAKRLRATSTHMQNMIDPYEVALDAALQSTPELHTTGGSYHFRSMDSWHIRVSFEDNTKKLTNVYIKHEGIDMDEFSADINSNGRVILRYPIVYMRSLAKNDTINRFVSVINWVEQKYKLSFENKKNIFDKIRTEVMKENIEDDENDEGLDYERLLPPPSLLAFLKHHRVNRTSHYGETTMTWQSKAERCFITINSYSLTVEFAPTYNVFTFHSIPEGVPRRYSNIFTTMSKGEMAYICKKVFTKVKQLAKEGIIGSTLSNLSELQSVVQTYVRDEVRFEMSEGGKKKRR